MRWNRSIRCESTGLASCCCRRIFIDGSKLRIPASGHRCPRSCAQHCMRGAGDGMSGRPYSRAGRSARHGLSRPSYTRWLPRVHPIRERGFPADCSRLDTLIAALGGTAEVARLFDRHPSTVCRWRSGGRPLPAAVANRMRELAGQISQEMMALAHDLKTDIRKVEERALRPRGYRQHSARGGYRPDRWARMSEDEQAWALELFRQREAERRWTRQPR